MTIDEDQPGETAAADAHPAPNDSDNESNNESGNNPDDGPENDTGSTAADGGSADADTTDGETTDGDSADQPLAAAPTRRAVASLALVVLAVAAAGALAWALLAWDDEQRAAKRETAALDVATRHLELLANLDHSSARDTLGQLRQGATSSYRKELGTVDDALFGLLEQGEVRSSGSVEHAAIAHIHDTRAQVLASVDTKFVNSEHPQGKRRSYRSVVSLRWHDDRWLVANAETMS